MILGFAESSAQAQALAIELGQSFGLVALHHFPDGESRLILPPCSAAHVLLYRSLDYPNGKLVELLLAAQTLRRHGVQRLTLVAPYMCYMRQDAEFHCGEAVSQGIIGEFLAGLFDDVITVDPHLHRVERLAQAIPARRAVSLSAAPLFGRYLAEDVADAKSREDGQTPLLLGPDEESAQWVSAIAAQHQLDYAVAHKQRQGDHAVAIQLPAVALAGRRVVVVDDVASTGHTLATIARQALAAGALSVRALITHALFAGDALQVIQAGGIADIVSSDSIPHPSNRVYLAPLLAAAVQELESRVV